MFSLKNLKKKLLVLLCVSFEHVENQLVLLCVRSNIGKTSNGFIAFSLRHVKTTIGFIAFSLNNVETHWFYSIGPPKRSKTIGFTAPGNQNVQKPMVLHQNQSGQRIRDLKHTYLLGDVMRNPYSLRKLRAV